MQLPDLNNLAVIHYGCPKFEEGDTIFWIGIIHYHEGEKTYEFWDGEEEFILKEYANYLSQNLDKIFIHWSMNRLNYGFPVFRNKAMAIGLSNPVEPKKVIDLSEYLKTKYGVNYVSRDGGRLDNLALLNGFSGKKNKIVVRSRVEASNRLELIFTIVQVEKQGDLIVNTEAIINPRQDLWNEKCYHLFIYLYQNYVISKKSKANFVRVMHYLRELSRDPSNDYVYRATNPLYISYISEHYNVDITNVDKPSNYEDQIGVLNNYRLQFESK